MAAGMLMPLDNLRAIYERLFRDGVMVAKKDKRPQAKHPELPGVGNLQVIRAMGSLKSRGFVRETFAWRHFYWYLTNEGIVYLRDYLHLPPEIVPTPLQRVRRPAATLTVSQRAARVQAIEGPTSYVPKPGRGSTESQEALLQRQEYRHKQVGTEEQRTSNEKTPWFRGRPVASDQTKPRESQFRDQVQPFLCNDQEYAREVNRSVGRKTTTVMTEDYKGRHNAALVRNTLKPTVSVDLQTPPAVGAMTASAVAPSMAPKNADKQKLKEEVSVMVSQGSTTSKSDVSLPSEKVAKTLQATEITNVKGHPVNEEVHRVKEKVSKSVTQMMTSKGNRNNEITLIEDLPKTMNQSAVTSKQVDKENLKEEVTDNISQESTTSKSAKDVPFEKQMVKTLQTTETKKIQECLAKEEMPTVTEKMSTSVAQKVPSEGYKKSDDKTLFESLPKTTDVVTVKTSMRPKKSGNEKLKEEVSGKVSQLASTQEQAEDASLPPSNKKVEKTLLMTKNLQEHPVRDEKTSVDRTESSSILESRHKTSVNVDPPAPLPAIATSNDAVTGKEQLTDKGSMNISQEASIRKQTDDAPGLPSSKKKEEKTVGVEMPRVTQEVSMSVTQKKVTTEACGTSAEIDLLGSLQETTVSVNPPAQVSATAAAASMSPNKADTVKPVEKAVNVFQEDTTMEQAIDASLPSSSKKIVEKQHKASTTKSVQQNSVKNEIAKMSEKVTMSVPAVHEVKLESEAKAVTELDLSKGEDLSMKINKDELIRSSKPPISEKKEDVAEVNVVVDNQETSKVNFAKQAAEPLLEDNDSTIASTEPPMAEPPKSSAQKSKKKKKKAQKILSTEETDNNEEASQDNKPISPNAPIEVEIPPEDMSTNVVKTEVKILPEISNAATDAETKETIIHKEIQMGKQTITTMESEKEVSKLEVTSVQQKPLLIKSSEDTSNKKEPDDAPKPKRRGKKKNTATLNQDLSPTAEIKAAEVVTTAQGVIKVPPSQGPETLLTNGSAKIPPEKMCTKEGQAAAVQTEAPAHKGEVESAQLTAEKIKREVLKGKTSSSQTLREAPTGQASAAASAQASPHPEQGEPPSVAQHSAAPDTQHRGEKQKGLSESKATAQPVTTSPLPTEEIICDTQALPEDETTMRKKIVVVEEVIEVQQIASPGADGSPSVVPSVPETVEGDDLDYDVLEELAEERALVQSIPLQELSWDHSLDEPEAKTFPNFLEGMDNFLLPCTKLCFCDAVAEVSACVCSVGGSR